MPKHWERLAKSCVKNRGAWKTAVRPVPVPYRLGISYIL